MYYQAPNIKTLGFVCYFLLFFCAIVDSRRVIVVLYNIYNFEFTINK